MYAYENRLDTLKGIHILNLLQHIYLQHNNLTELVGLENLANLEKLNVSHNRLANLEGLRDLKSTRFCELFVIYHLNFVFDFEILQTVS